MAGKGVSHTTRRWYSTAYELQETRVRPTGHILRLDGDDASLPWFSGIWTKHIKTQTQLHQTVVDRCLKTLTQKQLIKTVPDVRVGALLLLLTNATLMPRS